MAIAVTVKLSELEGAKRIDAELYQPQHLNIRRALAKIHHVKIGEIAQRCKKGIFDIKAENYVSSGIPFVRISNLKDGLIDDVDMAFIPTDIHQKEIKTEFHRNDIVLSKTAYPAASIIFFENCNISQDIIGISLKNSWKAKLHSAYLVAFLNSKYGLSEMRQWFQGNIQMHLALPDVRRFVIPILSQSIQQKISEQYFNAQEQIKKSKSLYTQAENLLLEELGLKNFKPKYELSYTANLSQAFSVHRVDAEYFQPAYDGLIQHLANNFETAPLKKFVLNFQKGIEVGGENYQEEGKPFIRVSNLSIYGLVERDQKYLSEELYQQYKDIYDPKGGDFLLTKDATPGITYVVEEPIEGIIASGILKLNINESEINKEYLAFYINSMIGKMQIERDGGGSVITHWRPEQIKNVFV